MTQVTSFLNDEHQDARASAGGTIGVLVSHKVLYSDPLFIMDLCTSLPPLVSDPFLNVRIRSSWALGNLAISIKLGQDLEEDACDISNEMIVDILKAAIISTKDHEKCKSHGVRAVGTVFALCASESFRHNATPLMTEAISCVLKQVESGPFKVYRT